MRRAKRSPALRSAQSTVTKLAELERKIPRTPAARKAQGRAHRRLMTKVIGQTVRASRRDGWPATKETLTATNRRNNRWPW